MLLSLYNHSVLLAFVNSKILVTNNFEVIWYCKTNTRVLWDFTLKV
jgi:hypothetical protein